MSPANRMGRLPSTAFVLLSNIVHFASAYPYALPQPTQTVDYHEINALPWPALATEAPGGFDLLNRRDLNTVCGYIGGDPALPATCSAGSHCVIDADHGAIGCCPDSGSCTQGVYTACVDSNSGAQAEVNPYVFTCQGSDVCYKNNFEGGYSQYGCGTASNLATTVAVTASGQSTIRLTSLSVTGTQSASTVDSTRETSSRTRSEKSATETSTAETSTAETSTAETSTAETSTVETSTGTESNTETETSSTESTNASTSDISSTATDTTKTDANSATSSVEATSSSTSAASAPDTDDDDNGSQNTGAIIGGTISGVAALVALIFLGIWVWKRKKGDKGSGQDQAALPGSESNGNIQPLLPMQETYDYHPPAPMPVARGSTITPVNESDEAYRSDPWYQQNYAYGYPPGSAVGDVGPGGNSSYQMDQDEVPLTRDNRDTDEFTQVYNSALGLNAIEEEQSRPPTAPAGIADSPTISYPGPRGGSGGPLWQQNRGPGWV
ncbi:hypothetical protein B0J13DRAFT_289759 [Dactylonectria estremocensis]|uniref:Mid2 domain-containing protein n=1 Tax=Dactylonectria estremocensis TaxID=1079267 RepID=A0A9P9J593_9HYPO|nr:hypothetical protein B0J13DRAFT_289759 [Dactylonectria estremocensis]